jgi:RNA polymerase sigma factor (sigma-70 family)
MTFEDFHPLLASTIAGIATEYGRKATWYGATREDFAQEMIAWLLDNEANVGKRFAEDTEEATRYAAKCLRNECRDHLSALRGQATGQSSEPQYDYGREELKVLLQLMLSPLDPPAQTVTITESIADVERAFEQLHYEDRTILNALHRDGFNNKMLAELYDISEANMSYRHNRAVLRLQRLLGGPQANDPDPFKGRRAMSNSAARARTNNNYEDGESA